MDRGPAQDYRSATGSTIYSANSVLYNIVLLYNIYIYCTFTTRVGNLRGAGQRPFFSCLKTKKGRI